MSSNAAIGISIIIAVVIGGFFYYLTFSDSEELKATIKKLQDKVDLLNNASETLKFEGNSKDQIISGNNLEIGSLKEKNIVLEQNVDNLEKNIESKNIKITELESLINDGSTNKTQLIQQLNELRMEFNKFKESICGFGTELIDNSCTVIMPKPIIQKSGYHSFKEDSPFYNLSKNSTYFHLEDFESKSLTVPGVTYNAGQVYHSGDGSVDSIDEDDGSVDGLGSDGVSFNLGERNNYLIFTFDENELGKLPTHVGIVVTDSTYGLGAPKFSQLQFSTIGSEGHVIHQTLIDNLDFGKSGSVDNDIFFGDVYENGIKQMVLAIDYGSIEVDHLQFGR